MMPLDKAIDELGLDGEVEELLVQWQQRRLAGMEVTAAELCGSSIELLPELQRRIAELKATDWMFDSETTADEVSVPKSSPPTQLGEYTILECLGAGGMGTVYKARHRRLDKLVALKVLLHVRQWERHAVERFEREMRAAGKLEHPHLVAAFDAGAADGTHYLAMQLINGVDVSRLAAMSGPLRVADACEIARQTALGLQYAHEHGLVHRDIKPSNLMLGHDGIVRVLDLGLARLDEPAVPGQQLTTSGHVLGTLDYMPPEQFEDTSHVDHRGDLYSLGATLFKLLSGRSPIEHIRGGVMKKMKALADGRISRLEELGSAFPARLVELVHQMLSVNPADRPQSAKEAAERLREFTSGHDLTRRLGAVDETSAVLDTNTVAVATLAKKVGDSVGAATSPRALGERGDGRWKIATGLIAVMVLIALAVVIAIQTDKGTLTITGDGVTVEQLKDAGVRLVHKQSQQTYDLTIGSQRQKSGDYLIAVTQQPSGLEFSAKEFTLARGTPQEVTVTFRPVVTPEVAAERWEFLQKLQQAKVEIVVALPDGSKRRIQSAKDIPAIRTVSFQGANATEENVCRLLEFTALKELTFHTVGSISQPVLEAIGKQTELTQLNFDVSPVGDDGLALLKDLKQIKGLVLWGGNLTDAGLAHLQHFPELESVELGSNPGIKGSGLAALRPLAKLRFVSVHNCALTDENLKSLKDLPQISQWAIGGRVKWTNAGLKELAGLNHIQELLIDKSELSDEGLQHLAQLPNLKKLRTRQSKVTVEGLAAFRRAKPDCKLESDP